MLTPSLMNIGHVHSAVVASDAAGWALPSFQTQACEVGSEAQRSRGSTAGFASGLFRTPLAAASAAAAVANVAAQRGRLAGGRRLSGSARVRHLDGPSRSTTALAATKQLHSSVPLLSTGTLEVSDGWELYYEEHGSAAGIPVVFLHGGPGAGCSRRMAQLFDPAGYRVVLFDQRGCGKSRRPGDAAAQLEANTTWHLVEDIEALRKHLGIDQWVVAGGSWGTTLALAYASRHQDHILGMVLRAACLFRDEEFDFFLGPGHGARTAAPLAWSKLTSWLSPAHEIALAFREAALGQDAKMKPQDAVQRWVSWEMTLMSAKPPTPNEGSGKGASVDPSAGAASRRREPPTTPWAGLHASQALLTMHYVVERGFFPANFALLEEARNFGFPLRIVHGRKDCVCPMKNAKDLAAAAPDADLLLTDGGHSQWDSANIDAFVSATDELCAQLCQPA
eukprot:CAMPEP_0115569962 /NCGR_PEP_ID=MMETSP0271-20121206/105458_1 /TAXON_ID=71861 /ORGANISM="Scrippsiella trochoidea, Strain CCMP3099" /LENGTH=449 /DNA_ID=CAMNT_0003004493 /DNA_START=70 /DNA_END=1419 /DNA_ORIENTATION=+